MRLRYSLGVTRLPESPSRGARGLYGRFGKRFLDVTFGTVLGVASLPVLGLVAVSVRLRLGRPVLFRQVRPGRHARPFEVVKFRTMRDLRGPDGALKPDAERLTALGRFLRSTSLDEVPELWLVVSGRMSLVGPRPLRMHYLGRYTDTQSRRHDLRPGITGWAQVNGRNSADWQERLARDVWYVDNVSLALDLKILAMTVKAVLTRDGIAADGYATAPEFMGNSRVQSGAQR